MNTKPSEIENDRAAANIRHNPFPVSKGFETIYSHAVEVPANARLLCVSGQIGVTPEGTVLSGFRQQFEQAIANLSTVLASAGMSTTDVVKLGFFVTRADDLIELGEIRRRLLPVRPAVTTLVVAVSRARNFWWKSKPLLHAQPICSHMPFSAQIGLIFDPEAAAGRFVQRPRIGHQSHQNFSIEA